MHILTQSADDVIARMICSHKRRWFKALCVGDLVYVSLFRSLRYYVKVLLSEELFVPCPAHTNKQTHKSHKHTCMHVFALKHTEKGGWGTCIIFDRFRVLATDSKS